MDVFESENQQLAMLKQIWKKYNRTILLFFVVFVIIFFGGKYWKNNKAIRGQRAAQIYQDMLVAEYQNDLNGATAKGMQLMADYKSTTYSQLAALMMAKIAVNENNLDLAVEKLEWILKHSRSKKITASIATVRLARVLQQQGKLDAALELVAKDPESSYISLYAQTRGDILAAKGDLESAKAAYIEALENLPLGTQSPSLQAKLLNLGGDDNA